MPFHLKVISIQCNIITPNMTTVCHVIKKIKWIVIKNSWRFILVGAGGFEPPKSLTIDLQFENLYATTCFSVPCHTAWTLVIPTFFSTFSQNYAKTQKRQYLQFQNEFVRCSVRCKGRRTTNLIKRKWVLPDPRNIILLYIFIRCQNS